MVPMSTQRTSRTIVVGTDGSPNAHRAAAWAITYAHPGDTVVLVHSWMPVVYGGDMPMAYATDDTAPRALLDEEAARFSTMAHDHQVELQTRLVQGDARTALVDSDADVIVLGARGHGGIVGVILGSVTDYVAHHAHVPLVIVPDPAAR